MATAGTATHTEQLMIEDVMQAVRKQKRQSGVTKLLGASSLVMALALPIGAVPRVMLSQELSHAQAKVVAQLPSVSVAQPQATPKMHLVTLPGSVQGLQDTSVYARTDGYVKNLTVDIGDQVIAGQLLAVIQTPELDNSADAARAISNNRVFARAQTLANLQQAKADVAKNVADLAQARSNLMQLASDEKLAFVNDKRFSSLVAQGAVSAADGDERRTRMEMTHAARLAGENRITAAQASLVAAQSQVHAQESALQASDAEIASAKASESRTLTQESFQKVYAPFSGVITQRNIEAGTLITSGSDSAKSPLFQISQIDTVRVFVDVPQYSAQGIKVGQNVSVTLKEFPGQTFVGKIARTSVALDASARTLRTEIHIPNFKHSLTPGMYADVAFSIQAPGQVLLLPGNSLYMSADGPEVAVVRGNKVTISKVSLGDDLGKQVEITAGLKGNEQVVINPSDSLHTGMLVSVSH